MARAILPCPHCGAAKTWRGNKWRCCPCAARYLRERRRGEKSPVLNVKSCRGDPDVMARRVARYAARVEELRQRYGRLSLVPLTEKVA